MYSGIVTKDHISLLLVFMEGIFSFFSPCIIPLIPVYMGFLAGNAKTSEDGTVLYARKKVFFHTLCFVLGISFAFFVLGMSFTTLGRFFTGNKMLFTRIGGILIIVLGLFQLGVFNFNFLQKERKFHLNLYGKEANPLIALILGFTFSFAWTPCIGPILSSVLIMASGAKTSFSGNLLVIVYTLGFVIPFLLLGLFTAQVLDFLKAKQKLVKYTLKAGGVILILMGIMTFTGWMNGISGYLNSISSNRQSSIPDSDKTVNNTNDDAGNNFSNESDSDIIDKVTEENEKVTEGVTTEADSVEEEEQKKAVPAFDFTLTDQYGKEHTLSDYKGQVVFLNFWASWCPPCKEEMPYIEELYKEYNTNEDEVVFLSIANPKNKDYPNNQDIEKDELITFLDTNGYTFPVLFDETGEILSNYYISAFPTTFMIDKEGNVFGYVPGMMSKDIMVSIIEQTLESTK